MSAASADAEYLRSHPEFIEMPGRIQAWILESPTAAAGFAGFFKQGGIVEDRPNVGLPYYSAKDPPAIFVEESQWEQLQANDAPAWPQRHLFGTLAHEIGHHRYNTGSVPFHGRTGEE